MAESDNDLTKILSYFRVDDLLDSYDLAQLRTSLRNWRSVYHEKASKQEARSVQHSNID